MIRFAVVFALMLFALWFATLDVHAGTGWPTSEELRRCEPWPTHDAKLRRWCHYWSKRLP